MIVEILNEFNDSMVYSWYSALGLSNQFILQFSARMCEWKFRFQILETILHPSYPEKQFQSVDYQNKGK